MSSESHSPLEQFVIRPLIDVKVGGIDLSFTQSSLWMMYAVIATTLLMVLSTYRKAIVPGRWQNIAEMLYEFILQTVTNSLDKEARKYFPLVFTVFMTVLMGNLLGLIPYSFTFTSHIVVTGAMAVSIFILATVIGFVKHGTHFFSLFLPKGLPLAIIPLILVIEIISYLSRPVSMSIRLFANMMAGHTTLKVFAGFSASLLGFTLAGLPVGAVMSFIPLLLNVALMGLELMVACIQAYVFAVLTCMYLRDAIELH